jgi:RimJ/RimL family protein N-acetyltransferase
MPGADAVRVRRMRAPEAHAVAQLMQATIGALTIYSQLAREREMAIYSAAYLRAVARRDRNAVLVAHAGGALAGFCVSRYDDDLIWLAWFGVPPEQRGLGVGAALLAALAQARQQEGVHKIWCDARTDNHASRACLARAGYREIATLADHWYRQDYVLLERLLAP